MLAEDLLPKGSTKSTNNACLMSTFVRKQPFSLRCTSSVAVSKCLSAFGNSSLEIEFHRLPGWLTKVKYQSGWAILLGNCTQWRTSCVPFLNHLENGIWYATSIVKCWPVVSKISEDFKTSFLKYIKPTYHTVSRTTLFRHVLPSRKLSRNYPTCCSLLVAKWSVLIQPYQVNVGSIWSGFCCCLCCFGFWVHTIDSRFWEISHEPSLNNIIQVSSVWSTQLTNTTDTNVFGSTEGFWLTPVFWAIASLVHQSHIEYSVWLSNHNPHSVQIS